MTTVDSEAVLVRTVPVAGDDPVFAGHYPGFPLLPGLFLVEYVLDAVYAAAPGLRPCAVERARFVRPVFPGDEVTVRAVLAGVCCRAEISTVDGLVAEIRVRYEVRS